jgi:hypothetical protein
MERYFVLIEDWAVYVKEGDFFESQGGLKEDWGKDWQCVYADGIEHARLLGELKRDGKKAADKWARSF